jgi:hypothetical protein
MLCSTTCRAIHNQSFCACDHNSRFGKIARHGRISVLSATTANRSANSASATSWMTRAAMIPPAKSGRSRVPQQSRAIVVRKLRSRAARAVELTHIWVMNPARIMFFRRLAASSFCKSVPAKAFGRVFSTTGSSGRGASRVTICPRWSLRSNRPPGLPLCAMWKPSISGVSDLVHRD